MMQTLQLYFILCDRVL